MASILPHLADQNFRKDFLRLPPDEQQKALMQDAEYAKLPDEEKSKFVLALGGRSEGDGTGWGPTIARMGGTFGGMALGGLAAGPLGILPGAMMGAGMGDVWAQGLEESAGERQHVNPLRTAAEVGLAALPGSSMTAPLKSAVTRGMFQGALSSTVVSLAEGMGLPTSGQFALATLSGGALSGVVHEGLPIAMKMLGQQALQELGGNPVAAKQLEEVVQGKLTSTDSPSTAEGIVEAGQMAKQLDLFTQGEFPLWRKSNPNWPDPIDAPKPSMRSQVLRNLRLRGKREMIQQELDLPVNVNPRDTVDGSKRQGDLFSDQPPSWRPRKLTWAEEDAFTNSVVDDELHVSRTPEHPPEGLATPDLAPTDKKLADVYPVTGRILSYLTPRRITLGKLQEATGYDVFGDWYKVNQAKRKLESYTSDQAKVIKDIFRGVDTRTKVAYSEWLTNVGERDRIARARGFKDADMIRLNRIRNFYDRALRVFGMGEYEFFNEVVPAWRRGEYKFEQDPQTGRMVSSYAGQSPLLSGRLRGLTEYVASGELGLGEPNSMIGVTKLLRASAFQQHVGDVWGELYTKYSDPSIPSEVKDHMMTYLNLVRGRPDVIGRQLTETMNAILKTIDPTGKKGYRTEANAFIGDLLAASYAGAMGWRIGPIIRNSMQPLQTGSALMGPRWFVEGLRQAATKEGRDIAAQAGYQGGIIHLAELEDAARSGLGKVLQGTAKVGLAPFGKIEDVGRRVVYLGTRAKVLEAASKAEAIDDPIKRLAYFIDRADIDRFEPAERRLIGDMYVKGDIQGAAHAGGNIMVDATQFSYRMEERPPILASTLGRALGGFGNWPLNYGAYLGRLTPGLAEGPTRKVMRDMARFTAVNAMIAGSFAGVGYSVGDQDAINDALGWTFLSPMFYTGGPVLETTLAGVKALAEVSRGNLSGEAINEFGRGLRGFVPFSGVYQDIMKASDEFYPEGKIGRITGFKRGKQ